MAREGGGGTVIEDVWFFSCREVIGMGKLETSFFLKMSAGSGTQYTWSFHAAAVLHQHYVPAKDRQRAHTLELHLSLPPLSTSSLSLQFNRAYLKWTEHKPDAHHGFYVKSVTEGVL